MVMGKIVIEISGDNIPDADDVAFNVYQMLEKDGYDVTVVGTVIDYDNM